jgi:single-strand DNA-binding protein
MRLIGVARLGRDAEVRYTQGQNSTAVANLSLAFNYGMKDQQTGNRPTQWVEASLWGKQAEALAEWLVKGREVFVDCDDVHIETYEGRNGPGQKLVARVQAIQLVGEKMDKQAGGQSQGGGQQSRAPAPAPAPRQNAARAPVPMDDDSEIPF